VSPPDRVVALDGSPNFRDLGGYRAGDGRRVRWGRIYRAGSLVELTPADRSNVASLGIGWVLDLRSDAEISSDPDVGARRVHLPVIDGTLDVEKLTAAVLAGDLGSIPDGLLVTGTALIATEFPGQWTALLDHLLSIPRSPTQ
jgi:protein-tyrosine phosphatase